MVAWGPEQTHALHTCTYAGQAKSLKLNSPGQAVQGPLRALLGHRSACARERMVRSIDPARARHQRGPGGRATGSPKSSSSLKNYFDRLARPLRSRGFAGARSGSVCGRCHAGFISGASRGCRRRRRRRRSTGRRRGPWGRIDGTTLMRPSQLYYAQACSSTTDFCDLVLR